MILRMKNFNILGVHLKIQLLGGGVTTNQYRGGDCLKEGAWTVYRFQGRGGLARKRVLFLKGGGGWGDTPMHTMAVF